jgi:predicted acylesterase/phospholipase RssA
VIDALAVDSGRICHFVNWPDPSPEFVARVEGELGEVQAVRDPEDVIRAAVASSAVPGVFEPVRIGGRDFVDAGGFSNQPLHVAVAADADAAVVVLMAPSTRPGGAGDVGMLMELVGRLVDIANWRDMQFELRSLPAAWSSQMPAPIVRVEPPEPLPGSLLGFDPSRAVTLIEHGERDMWAALERAGWLEPDPVGA